MLIYLLACSKEHSSQGPWIISKSPWFGNVTGDESYEFMINSQGVLVSPRPVDQEKLMPTIVQCLKISELWVYVEQLLSCLRRVQLLNQA